MKTLLIIAAIILALSGCYGTGGLGGQGIAITAETRSAIRNVTITINDGGTDLAGRVTRPEPTTQPAGNAERGE
jgi:hypothetical protein